MTEPTRKRGGGFASSLAFSAGRGALLIGLAIVVGLVLLQVVDNAGSSSSSGSVTPTTDAPATSSTSPSTTTLPTGDTAPPNEIRVLVLNGADQEAPLAGTTTTTLKSKGYQTIPPNNTDPQVGTKVYCQQGFEADTEALATSVGPNAAAQSDFPESPPKNATDTSSYDCLVVLGS